MVAKERNSIGGALADTDESSTPLSTCTRRGAWHRLRGGGGTAGCEEPVAVAGVCVEVWRRGRSADRHCVCDAVLPMPRHRKEKKPTDLYAVFGVNADVDDVDLRKHYRKLCLANHPDKVAASERDAATAKLAEINSAWDILGDPERRRVYDMQREADGVGCGGTRRGSVGTLLRRAFVGSSAPRTFSWSSGLPYLSDRHANRLHHHLQRNRPALIFLHLGGSPRSARAAEEMLETHRRLRGGAALVAAVDVEASPMLARSLGAEPSALPSTVLFTARNGMRHFEQPLNASHLVAATVSAMPDLPTACTANQYRELLSVSRGAGGAGGLVLVLRRELRLAVRSACAAHTMAIACATGHRGHRRLFSPSSESSELSSSACVSR